MIKRLLAALLMSAALVAALGSPSFAGAGPAPIYSVGATLHHHSVTMYGDSVATQTLAIKVSGRTVTVSINPAYQRSTWINTAYLYATRHGGTEGPMVSFSWNMRRQAWMAVAPRGYNPAFAYVELQLLPTCSAGGCG